ncbi:MAG: preprotein translocase subunit SecG [Xanthomonadales bacterium]|nr:preprotein translocase subunit SecG [Xanthomonadales bacterium]
MPMQILNIFHVLVAIAMVAFVLVQRGPGATAGAAFGSGASGTVFGSRGAGSFLSRATWVMATLFCLISLTMAVIVSRTVDAPETDLGVVASQQQEAPAADGLNDLPDLTDAGQDSDLPELDTVTPDDVASDLPAANDEAGGEGDSDGDG